MAGQKEYEVELQFSSGILNVPDRIKAAEDVTFDGEKVPLIHNDDDLDNISNEQGRVSRTAGLRTRWHKQFVSYRRGLWIPETRSH